MKRFYMSMSGLSVAFPVEDENVKEVERFIQINPFAVGQLQMDLLESNIEVVMFMDEDSLELKTFRINQGNRRAPVNSILTEAPREIGDPHFMIMCPEDFLPVVSSGEVMKAINVDNWDKVVLYYKDRTLSLVYIYQDREEYWNFVDGELIQC